MLGSLAVHRLQALSLYSIFFPGYSNKQGIEVGDVKLIVYAWTLKGKW